MARYRVFHLKDPASRAFREAKPKSPPYVLKRHEYEGGSEIEAANPYEAWERSRSEQEEPGARRIDVGDVLETESSELMIMNFWGFEEALWEGTKDPAASEAPDLNVENRNQAAAEGGQQA